MPNMPGRDRSRRAPYAPGHGILMPILSLVLSVPTLLVGTCLTLTGLYDALTGHSLYAGAPRVIQVPVLACLPLVLGPMLAAVLCTTQRTRAQEVYGSDLLLGYRIKRMNRIGLWCAALALLSLVGVLCARLLLHALHPH